MTKDTIGSRQDNKPVIFPPLYTQEYMNNIISLIQDYKAFFLRVYLDCYTNQRWWSILYPEQPSDLTSKFLLNDEEFREFAKRLSSDFLNNAAVNLEGFFYTPDRVSMKAELEEECINILEEVGFKRFLVKEYVPYKKKERR